MKHNNKNGMAFFGNNEKVEAQFEPFPNNIGFNFADGSQDIQLLLETLDSIPSISQMQKYSSDEQLKVVLDDISPLVFPLLSWTIKSNRAHLSLIPLQNQVEVRFL
jgi:hypothetical protein